MIVQYCKVQYNLFSQNKATFPGQLKVLLCKICWKVFNIFYLTLDEVTFEMLFTFIGLDLQRSLNIYFFTVKKNKSTVKLKNR